MRLLFGLVVVSMTITARSQEGARVLLLSRDPSSTTSARLAGELRSFGMQVMVVVTDDRFQATGERLGPMVRGANAFAAVRVVKTGLKVEVWLFDPPSGDPVFLEVGADPGDLGIRDDTLAIRTAEILRSSLLARYRRVAGSHEPAPPVARDQLVTSPPRLRRSSFRSLERARLRAALGPTTDTGMGGIGPSLGLELSLGWQSPRGWGLRSLYARTLVPAVLARQEGRAEIRMDRVSLFGTVPPSGTALEPLLGFGVSVVRFEVEGHARLPLRGAIDHLWMVGPTLEAGAALELGGPVRLRSEVELMMALRSGVLRFREREVARWGQPALMASLAVELAWPATESGRAGSAPHQ